MTDYTHIFQHSSNTDLDAWSKHSRYHVVLQSNDYRFVFYLDPTTYAVYTVYCQGYIPTDQISNFFTEKGYNIIFSHCELDGFTKTKKVISIGEVVPQYANIEYNWALLL